LHGLTNGANPAGSRELVVQPLLVVPHSDIDVAGVGLEAELPPSWLDAQLEEASAVALGSGRVSARLSSSGRADVVVRGEVEAKVRVPCARCLGPAELDLHGELSLLLQPRPGLAHEHGGSSGRRAPRASSPKPGSAGQAKASSKGEVAQASSVASAPKARDSVRGASSAKRGAGVRAAAAAKATLPEYEFSSEEAEVDEYDGERVVLDSFVREALLLELPSFPLCSEACPGIDDAPSLGHVPAAEPSSSGRSNPFEALRQLLPDGGSEEPAPPPRPSSRELSKAAKASHKSKPRIRASLAHRTKK
jgi:uncharacterized protein